MKGQKENVALFWKILFPFSTTKFPLGISHNISYFKHKYLTGTKKVQNPIYNGMTHTSTTAISTISFPIL